MLEAWLIGGACAVVAFGLGLLVGTKTSDAYYDEAERATGRRNALADAIDAAERVQKAVPTRSLCGRAIVARLRQLADDAGVP